MRTAIVTGGSRGFGRALVTALVSDGYVVITDGRDPDTLAVLRGELGQSVRVVPGDHGDPAHQRRLVEVAEELGGLDVLVNNAGALGPSPLPRLRALEPTALGELFGTNVVAPLGLMAAALPLLVRREGAIVNVTSDAAVEAYAGWGAYGATKAALEQLSNVLAVEEPDVRVWWLDPGDLRTDMHQAAFPGEDISDRADPASVAPAILALLAERPPSGRVRAVDLLGGDR